ncbi:MAG: class I SAM-dependent methyltransferase [Clostridia bacterium]|nr:class I SAM-dependent methyltransferase [Clostridia bacterium]
MSGCYTALGRFFEYMNDDCDYLAWSQYLIAALKKRSAGPEGVDMGCGNGYFTRALEKAGYAMTGVDPSPEMLSVASEKATGEGCRARYFLGDITSFPMKGKDFCVAANDVLNYVPPKKMVSAMRNVFSGLRSGGIFLFDVSSEKKLRETLAGNTFCDVRDDVSYIWFNELEGDRLTMDLTFFIRRGDGAFVREDETHIQYVHREEDVVSAMRNAGFTDIVTEGHLGGVKDERINFAGIKP